MSPTTQTVNDWKFLIHRADIEKPLVSVYAETFAKNNIDMDILAQMEKDSVLKLGIPVCDYFRIRKAMREENAQKRKTKRDPFKNEELKIVFHDLGHPDYTALSPWTDNTNMFSNLNEKSLAGNLSSLIGVFVNIKKL
jgi:hypothetical protein